MKIQCNQIRHGNVIEYNGKPMSVLKIQLIQPGKGGAFIHVEMRDVATGIKTNDRFRTSETIEKLDVSEQHCTYLFAEDDNITLMDVESYEQFTVARDMLGDGADFLQDGMEVTVDLVEGSPVSVRLPQTVVMEVVEADPVVKGQTATSSYKPAVLENGVRILVPPHIETGTKVVVNTAELSYVERAKN
ncbi:MAG: elongation factor P [Alphaproteobacteria bacterium]